MRRVYYMNPRRTRIVNEAMERMRAAEDALGPEFLTRIRMLVKDFDPEMLKGMGVDPAHLMPEARDNGKEPVDRRKNLAIVMKYLQLKEHNKNVQSQVRTFLSELPK